jgi:diacylglycerol kinase (ATP)
MIPVRRAGEGNVRRLLTAAGNSARAWRFLIQREAAFRLEVIIFALALPAAYWLSPSWRGYGLLMASILVLMIVEVLNTAVEAACNAVTRAFDVDVRLAKDCGSLAVALAMILAAGVWGIAIWERLAGAPV